MARPTYKWEFYPGLVIAREPGHLPAWLGRPLQLLWFILAAAHKLAEVLGLPAPREPWEASAELPGLPCVGPSLCGEPRPARPKGGEAAQPDAVSVPSPQGNCPWPLLPERQPIGDVLPSLLAAQTRSRQDGWKRNQKSKVGCVFLYRPRWGGTRSMLGAWCTLRSVQARNAGSETMG